MAIPPEAFEQGKAMFYVLVRSGCATDAALERAASLLADFHGISAAGERFTFEVEAQAAIRLWLLRGAPILAEFHGISAPQAKKDPPYPWCAGNPTRDDCAKLGYCPRKPSCGD